MKKLQIIIITVLSLFLFSQNISAQVLNEDQKLMPNGVNSDDAFGNSIAVSGEYAIIGARGTNNLNGAAYIYKNSNGDWIEEAKLIASDSSEVSEFGISVDISGDYAIVGSFGNGDSVQNCGCAYIYKNEGGNWTEITKLTASDAEDSDLFGASVGISGNYAVIGAVWDDDNGSKSGSAYIFYNDSGSWSEVDKILPGDGDVGDWFGASVSISGDYVLVGSFFDDDNGGDSGSAYIFYNSGGNWVQQAKLTASDGNTADSFGRSVKLSNETAVIGAYAHDNHRGAAYIFEKPSGGWVDMNETQKITPSSLEENDKFGTSVAVNGNFVIVGTQADEMFQRIGYACVFKKNEGAWEELIRLEPTDGEDDDRFGFAVAIEDDQAFVGAIYDDDYVYNSGATYFYDLNTIGIGSIKKDNSPFSLSYSGKNIQLTGLENFKGQCAITDATGKTMFHSKVNGNITIDASHFSPGVYFVNIVIDNRNYTQKVIIR